MPLSPLAFLTRSAAAFWDKVAMIDGDRRFTYGTLHERCIRLGAGVARVGRLDTVAILASNVPEMIEAHYAMSMLGAVLNPLNTRLDAAAVAFPLSHRRAKVLIADQEFAALVAAAVPHLDHETLVIGIGNPDAASASAAGAADYETMLAGGDPAFSPRASAPVPAPSRCHRPATRRFWRSRRSATWS